MIREILQKGSAILNQQADAIVFNIDNDKLSRISRDINDTLTHLRATHEFTKGVGLAAPQIGYSKRVFGYAAPNKEINIYVNPEIVKKSDNTDFQYEGCLSFFQVRGRVMRSKGLRLKYFDLTATFLESFFVDGCARIIQHEMDHLNGILYPQRMTENDHLVPYDEYLRMKERNWHY